MPHRKTKLNPIRALLLVLCFLAAFFASLEGIRLLTPRPYVPNVSERLAVFEAGKDDYTVLFIGSSQYLNGIDPGTFDRLTAEAGFPTTTFNFSLRGMQLPEAHYLLRRIRAMEPANLEWVVLEPRTMATFPSANRKTRRLVYFHDLPATVMALRCLQHKKAPHGGRTRYYRMHLEQFGLRQTNQGLLQSMITDLYHGDAPARKRRLAEVKADEGYVPRHGHSFNMKNLKYYKEDLRQYGEEYRTSPLKPMLAEQLDRLLREVEGMGARPFFLFAPSMRDPEDLVLPPDAPAVDIIRLDDPERHPELFDMNNRHEHNHLNHQGAQLTTAAAAEAILGIVHGQEAD